MTPDDMEGRSLAALHPLAEAINRAGTRPRITMDGFAAVEIIHAFNVLLLDYQERGRALEELLASTVGPEVGASDGGTFVIQPPSPDALRRARATLKGKSHD